MSRLSGKFKKKDVKQEVPTGTINGSNTTFTLSESAHEQDSLMVFKNGLLQKYTTDYTLSGTTITFVTAPATASELVIVYDQNVGE